MKCEDCKYKFGQFSCGRNLFTHPFTGIESDILESRDENKKGTCLYYISKWAKWKFWKAKK